MSRIYPIDMKLFGFFFHLLLSVNIFSLKVSSDQLIDLYKQMVEKYPVVSIEDPFDQDDWEAYSKMTSEMPIQIVG